MMPHIERAVYPWQWANYPSDRKDDQVTPGIESFVNALEWIKKTKGKISASVSLIKTGQGMELINFHTLLYK
jgi:hypothetical protein